MTLSRSTVRFVGLTFVLALLGTMAAAPASAQSRADAHWNDWLGCWALVADADVTRLPPAEDAGGGITGPIRPGASRSARICVAPSQGGAELRTLVGDQQVLSQTIVADGADHAIAESGCRGTQRSQWSADGFRLFSRAQVTCDTPTPRTVTGLSLIGPDGQWIDVQAVTIEGRDSVRVRRFRRVDTPRPTDPPAAAVRLTVEHVKEASRLVAPRALEAALIETSARFPLSSKVLRDLDKADVPDSVTDLMVALSFPRAFAVRPSGPDDRLTPFPPLYPDFVDASIDYPYFYGPYASSYFYSPYFFSPFGYSYLRYYPQFIVPGAIIGGGGGDGGGGSSASPPRDGRAINGRGYTRVVPRDRVAASEDGGASTPRSSGAARGTVTPRGYTATDGGASSGSSGGGNSSSGGSSSSGGGAASGGGDSGRTAVPR
jgi:hypothetical protein